MRIPGSAALGLACVCAIAACGSPYTKQDFIARADAICANAVRDTLAIPPPTFSGTSSQQLTALAQYLAQVLPIYRSEATQLFALRRPHQSPGERATLIRFLQAVSEAEADLHTLAAAAKRGDPQGVAGAEAALSANPVGDLAAGYGLKSCGTTSATVS